MEFAAGVVVVGGGPSGYATAMALSKHGFKDILVLERSESAGTYNPTVGFIYNISGPGRQALKEIGVTHMADIGTISLLVNCSRSSSTALPPHQLHPAISLSAELLNHALLTGKRRRRTRRVVSSTMPCHRCAPPPTCRSTCRNGGHDDADVSTFVAINSCSGCLCGPVSSVLGQIDGCPAREGPINA